MLITSPAILAADAHVTVDRGDDPLRPIFVVALPEVVARQLADRPAGKALLQLARLDSQTGERGPPVFGTEDLKAGALRFQPDFRLSPGARYVATLSLPDRPPISLDYTAPAPDVEEQVTVQRVYPTADALPANLLKFYVYFSRPMRQTDQIFDRMHILNAEGKPVHDPWRRFQQWSDDGKRLTLWIHPGRIKQGVNLREELGPVLVPGQRFTLRIDATLEDLSGKPMAAVFEKRFTATAEDRNRLDLTQWKLTAPRFGSREPLRVTFSEPLDQALLRRLITIQDAAGRAMEGKVEVGEGELCWSFTPAGPWSVQKYELVADELLEDLAGNTPVRVFDADMKAAKAPPITRLTFEPSSGK